MKSMFHEVIILEVMSGLFSGLDKLYIVVIFSGEPEIKSQYDKTLGF